MTKLFTKLRSSTLGIAAAGLLASQGAYAALSVDANDGTVDGVGDVVFLQTLGTGNLNDFTGAVWPVIDLGGGAGLEVFFLDWTSLVVPPLTLPPTTVDAHQIGGGSFVPGSPANASFYTVYTLPLTFLSADPLDGWTYDVGGSVTTCFDGDGTNDDGMGDHDCTTNLIDSVVTGGGTNGAFLAGPTGVLNTSLSVTSEATTIACDFIFRDGQDLCTLDPASLLTKLTRSNLFTAGLAGDCSVLVGTPLDPAINPGTATCQDVLPVISSSTGFAEDQTIVFNAAVPEPATLGMLGLGLLGLGAVARRRRAR